MHDRSGRRNSVVVAARDPVKEPGAEDAWHFRRRVKLLAAEYVGLFLAAVVGIGLLVWKAQLFVTLTQRSNVETLTLAFFCVFFGYLAVLSAPGARGGLRVAWYGLQGRLGQDRDALERRKMRALGQGGGGAVVNLNMIIEVEGRPGEPFELPVADRAGPMGRLRIDGSRIQHLPAHGAGSSELLAYAHLQVVDLLRRKGQPQDIEIVAWKATDDEQTEQYHALVEFARNLERQLGKGELWPKVRLADADCRELERRLAAICPALRDESFLPHWDYRAEHKLPIIPEPLGLVSLSRAEPRVDPVSSMGCALWVVLAAVAVSVLFIVFPPWVPGT
jgi:hypothetical protein